MPSQGVAAPIKCQFSYTIPESLVRCLPPGREDGTSHCRAAIVLLGTAAEWGFSSIGRSGSAAARRGRSTAHHAGHALSDRAKSGRSTVEARSATISYFVRRAVQRSAASLHYGTQRGVGTIKRLPSFSREVHCRCHPGMSVCNNGCTCFICFIRRYRDGSEAFVDLMILEKRPYSLNVDNVYSRAARKVLRSARRQPQPHTTRQLCPQLRQPQSPTRRLLSQWERACFQSLREPAQA